MSDWLRQFDLNHKVTIKRQTITNDSYCNQTTSTSTIVTDEPCALWMATGNEVVIGDVVHNPINYTMAIKPSTKYLATDVAYVSGKKFKLGAPHDVANEKAIMVFSLESVE